MNLTSPRLLLRPIRMADAPLFHAQSSLPDVAINAGFLPSSMADIRKQSRIWVDEWRKAEPEKMTFSILLQGQKTWIGSIELRWIQKGVGEIGFLIHPKFWGHGYATEAAKAVMHWAFTQGQAHRIQASCWTKNAPSIKVLEK